MSTNYSPQESPLAREKMRQYDSDNDDEYNTTRDHKRIRLSEHLEETYHLDITSKADPSLTQKEDIHTFSNQMIKANPPNANAHHSSSTYFPESCHIRTEPSQQSNYAMHNESLLQCHIIKESYSQDATSEPELRNHPRYLRTRQILEAGETYNASSEYMQKGDGLGGDDTGCTASGDISQNNSDENNSSSDHLGGAKIQFVNDRAHVNNNDKALPRNEEEVNPIKVPSPFHRITRVGSIDKKPFEDVSHHSVSRSPPHIRQSQGVNAITPQNRHLSISTTKEKLRISKVPRSLLQQVLSRPKAPVPLNKFSFLEDEIEFIDVIGGNMFEDELAQVFRIIAGGRNYVLKVHKYMEVDIFKSDPQYPFPNKRFDLEAAAYARTAPIQDLPSSPIPKCYGHVELTKIPQPRSRHRSDPFRSTEFRHAAYLGFLLRADERIVTENQRWRRYFRDRPPSACILRGIVLEYIPSWSLLAKRPSNQPQLLSSGRESLARLHECGVLHGNVGALHHALFTQLERRIVWVGLSNSRPYGRRAVRNFDKRAAREVHLWESFFPKQRSPPKKQK